MGGRRNSLGSRRGGGGGGAEEEEDDHEQELREIGDLDAAAPSQEEIRLMIDRIRRESVVDDVVVGGRSAASAAAGKVGSRFEHEVRPRS